MKEPDSERVEFRPPKDFTPPAGSEKGEFDLVCTFHVKDNGDICLVMLGDTKMPGYDDTEKAEHKPDYEQYSKGMAETMMASGSNPGSSSEGY